MLSALLRRIVLGLVALLGVTIVAFALVRIVPGDPVEIALGERGVDPQRHAELVHRLGLDRSWPVQYGVFLGRLVQGDLGTSLSTHEPVLREFWPRFAATLELSACAMAIAITLGIGAGLVAALARGRWPDHLLNAVTLAGYSMPIFWWGVLLIMLFSVHLGLTPVSGRLSSALDVPPVTGFMLLDAALSSEPGALRSTLSHLVLPSLVLATIPLAVIARVTRAAVLEVARSDFVRALRARGIAPGRIVRVHVLRNALVPIVTVMGVQVGQLLSGAILTETLFAWPGVGKWLVDAVGSRDYPVVQGAVVLIAATVVLVNIGVDAAYTLLDPRVRRPAG